jgi:hypothetical protein
MIFILRYAANLAASAALIRLESKKDLNAIREEAARSLNAVCSLLDKRRVAAVISGFGLSSKAFFPRPW